MESTTYTAENPAAALVLAHGAGAGRTSGFMTQAGLGFAARAIETMTFDFPYISAGRRVPDRAPVLEAAWREAIATARARWPELPLFIGGKSMGGRIASQVVAAGVAGVRGLIYLGYPLHPPGKPEARRDAHLPSIRLPMLFVQGGRDAFGTAADIRELLPRLAVAELHEVIGGDHSFKVAGRGAPPARAILETILDAAAAWMLRRERLV